jgi:hypothetical protein
MPARRPIYAYLCAMLLLSACSSGPDANGKMNEASQDAVYLTRVSDRSFHAAHPIKIDASVIAMVLNGILVRDSESGASAISGPDRAFSGSEVGYLAPLISESLRRAESDQQVGFRIGEVAGAVYAYGRSLYVTLTQYRSGFDAATARALSFDPEAAKRPDSYLDPRSTQATLAIDYELLAVLPAASMPSASAPAAPAPPQHTTNRGQTDPPNKDSEIEALRKELQEIKKQLAEQQAERARSAPK